MAYGQSAQAAARVTLLPQPLASPSGDSCPRPVRSLAPQRQRIASLHPYEVWYLDGKISSLPRSLIEYQSFGWGEGRERNGDRTFNDPGDKPCSPPHVNDSGGGGGQETG